MEPAFSWILVKFFSTEPQQELPGCILKVEPAGLPDSGFRVMRESKEARMTLCRGHAGDPAPKRATHFSLVPGAGGITPTGMQHHNPCCLLSPYSARHGGLTASWLLCPGWVFPAPFGRWGCRGSREGPAQGHADPGVGVRPMTSPVGLWIHNSPPQRHIKGPLHGTLGKVWRHSWFLHPEQDAAGS